MKDVNEQIGFVLWYLALRAAVYSPSKITLEIVAEHLKIIQKHKVPEIGFSE